MFLCVCLVLLGINLFYYGWICYNSIRRFVFIIIVIGFLMNIIYVFNDIIVMLC